MQSECLFHFPLQIVFLLFHRFLKIVRNKENDQFLNLGLKSIVLIHLVFLVLKLIWVTNWSLELHYEEAQYWLWGTKLDWSYYSKPGMIGWMNFLSTKIFGHTILAIKFPAVVAGFIISITLYCTAQNLFNDQRVSALSSFLIYLMPFYYSVTLFHSTDSFLVAFTVLSFYWFERAIATNKTSHWLYVAVFIGLATLTKYSGILVSAGYLVYLLFYQRKLIPKFIVTQFAIVVFLLPILIWNVQNDFVTLKHVDGASGGGDSFKIDFGELGKGFIEYLSGQWAIISPFLFFFLIKNKVRSKHFPLLILPSLFVFLFFILILIKGNAAPNVNWPFFNYSSLAIFFAYILYQRKKVKWLIPIAIFQAFLFILISNTSYLDKIGLGKLIAPEDDPTLIYHRWEQLENGVEERLAELDDETILLLDNYKVATPLQFYLGLDEKVYYLGTGNRSNQLSYWNEIAEINPIGKKFLFITPGDELRETITNQFANIRELEPISITWRGEIYKYFYVYELEGATNPLKSFEQGY